MLWNYVKIAWRNLGRRKLFAAVNILSLTVGLTCVAFLYLCVHQMLSRDKFHDHLPRLFLVETNNAEVSGVMKPIPPNASIRPAVLLWNKHLTDDPKFTSMADWYNTLTNVYVLLRSDKDKAMLEAQLKKVVATRFAESERGRVLKLLPYGEVAKKYGNLSLACWVMNRWLQDFAYRITIPWWLLTGAGILVVLIALFTVSLQSVRTALINPTKALRTDDKHI